MMKKIMKFLSLITSLFCCALSIKAQVNLVLNGSFELNSIVPPNTDLLNTSSDYDSHVMYSHHFGDDHTTSIWEIPFLVCSPPVLWGGGAKDGDAVLELYAIEQIIILPPDTFLNIKQGKISLKLDAPLSNVKRYKLSFWIKYTPIISPCPFDIENNYINVGISNYEDQLWRYYFGRIHLYI